MPWGQTVYLYSLLFLFIIGIFLLSSCVNLLSLVVVLIRQLRWSSLFMLFLNRIIRIADQSLLLILLLILDGHHIGVVRLLLLYEKLRLMLLVAVYSGRRIFWTGNSRSVDVLSVFIKIQEVAPDGHFAPFYPILLVQARVWVWCHSVASLSSARRSGLASWSVKDATLRFLLVSSLALADRNEKSSTWGSHGRTVGVLPIGPGSLVG